MLRIQSFAHRKPPMSQPHEEPAIGKDAFDCPSCGAFAHQTWHRTELRNVPADAVEPPSDTTIFLEQVAFNRQVLAQKGVGLNVTVARGLYASRCDRCHALALWFDDRRIWPRTGAAPPADAGLPDAVRKLYDEAAVIAEGLAAGGGGAVAPGRGDPVSRVGA